MSYNPNVPATGHSPAQDYQAMQQNYSTIQSTLGIDHITVGTSLNPGTHQKMTFNGFASPAAPVSIGSSVAYPAAGQASTTTAQMYLQNTNATLLMSAVRVFANITINHRPLVIPLPPPSLIDSPNSFNIDLPTSTQIRLNGGSNILWRFVITLKPNSISTNAASVFINTDSSTSTYKYVLTPTQLTIDIYDTASTSSAANNLNIAILQV